MQVRAAVVIAMPEPDGVNSSVVGLILPEITRRHIVKWCSWQRRFAVEDSQILGRR